MKERCAVCKKKITPNDHAVTLGAAGKDVVTCCSGKCFGILCDLAPKMVMERRKKRARNT